MRRSTSRRIVPQSTTLHVVMQEQSSWTSVLLARLVVIFFESENLLTITVPTGLPPKATFKGGFSGTFASYDKTSWESVAKILAENCIGPASWATNELGIPMQYPCYGFFGYSCEITDPDNLKRWPIKICTSNLYRIGKGQNPSGIIATCKTPKLIRVQSGGTTSSNAFLCDPRNRSRERRRNSDEFEVCLSVLCGINPLCLSDFDHQGAHPGPWLNLFNCWRCSRTTFDLYPGGSSNDTTEVANLLRNLLKLHIIESAIMTTKGPILEPVTIVAVTTIGNLILLGIKTDKIADLSTPLIKRTLPRISW